MYWEEKQKMSLLANNIIIHAAHPEASTLRWAEFISEFGEIVRFKSNTKISCISVYSKEHWKGEIKQLHL